MCIFRDDSTRTHVKTRANQMSAINISLKVVVRFSYKISPEVTIPDYFWRQP